MALWRLLTEDYPGDSRDLSQNAPIIDVRAYIAHYIHASLRSREYLA